MKKFLQSKLVFLCGLFIALSVLFTPLAAVRASGYPPTEAECKDPSNPKYATQECINVLLGLSKVNTNNSFLNPVNPRSLTTVVFQIVLAIVIVIVVARILLSGITIANAKEDADKRKEGLKSILNAVLGLALAFSAYGIASFVLSTVGVDVNNLQYVDCSSLPQNTQDEIDVYNRCLKLQ